MGPLIPGHAAGRAARYVTEDRSDRHAVMPMTVCWIKPSDRGEPIANFIDGV
jgi:hypothetical protein